MPITTGFAPWLSKKAKTLIKNFALQLDHAEDIQGDRFFKYENFGGDDEAEYFQFYGIQGGKFVPEGSDPQAATPTNGYTKKVNTRQFGRSIVISRKAKDFADTRIAQWNRMLMASAMETKELWKASFYTYALDGSTVPTASGVNIVNNLAIDGNEYFHGSHTWQATAGVTNSNLSSAARTLTLANLTSAAQQARGWQGPRGLPMQLPIKSLVVGDNLIETARVLLNSMQVPGNANNDNNQLRYINYGSGIENIEHWSLMGTGDWMLRFDISKLGNPGWCVGEYEKMRSLSYQSNSGERHVYGYLMECEVYGVEPYEYLTSRAAAA